MHGLDGVRRRFRRERAERLACFIGGSLAAVFLASCRPEFPGPGEAVNQASFQAQKKLWPLTVTDGRVGCWGLSRWFQDKEGNYYLLNGIDGRKPERFIDLHGIWKPDAEINAAMRKLDPSTAVHPIYLNIGDLTAEAAKFCDR